MLWEREVGEEGRLVRVCNKLVGEVKLQESRNDRRELCPADDRKDEEPG